MNPWPFVAAAYGVTLGVTALVVLWSWRAMRVAERGGEK